MPDFTASSLNFSKKLPDECKTDGGVFAANFYYKDIRFIIGEHKGMLHPAGNPTYALPTGRDAFNMAPVAFEFLQDDKCRTASDSTVRFLPGMRYLISAHVDPASGRPRISTIQDRTPQAGSSVPCHPFPA